ncbi:MAG: phosphoribosylanthranilate isomerase [Pirellulaceae bacterium]
MFQIKVCGIRTVADAQVTAAAGADALGLNFYVQSKRYVESAVAGEIADAVRDRVSIVALMVNHSLAEIREITTRVRPDWIQLHGDETCEFAHAVFEETGCPILMACRGAIVAEKIRLNESAKTPWQVDAVLMDGLQPGSYGGTGVVANWDALADWHNRFDFNKLVLAGGLRPDNVAQAIRTVRPTAVDVAGGVEREPGIKDPELVAQFVAQVKSACGNLSHPQPD